MPSLKNFQTQVRYAFKYSAYPLSGFFRQLVRFPLSYYAGFPPAEPLAITLMVTLRCNLSCVMCSFNPVVNKGSSEMGLEAVKAFIDDNASYRPGMFLSGGEPFVRNDILEIIRHIKLRKMRCGVCTNGLLLQDERKLRQLIDTGIDYIIFSMHGTAPVHDAVVRQPGAWDRLAGVVANFARLKKKNQQLFINCALTAGSIPVLPELVRATKSLDIDALILQHLSYLSPAEAARHEKEFRAVFGETINSTLEGNSPERVIEAVREARRTAAEVKLDLICKPDLSDDEVRGWYAAEFSSCRRCLLPWGSPYVMPDGEVYPCQYVGYRVGNVQEKPLRELWRSPAYEEFRRQMRQGLKPFCARCCKL